MSKKNGDFNWAESVGLKEYFDMRIRSQEEALDLARESLEKRLDTMNEFRQSLKDQQSTFITHNEYNAKHELLQAQVDQLRLKGAELSGKADQRSVTIVMIFSLISATLGLISLVESLVH